MYAGLNAFLRSVEIEVRQVVNPQVKTFQWERANRVGENRNRVPQNGIVVVKDCGKVKRSLKIHPSLFREPARLAP
jgi:hypothetical protein